jgi:hypothetical protein
MQTVMIEAGEGGLVPDVDVPAEAMDSEVEQVAA